MRFQVVFKRRHFSYDQDWLDAFSDFGGELVETPTKLDAELIVIHHSITGQWSGYPEWIKRECLSRKGRLVIFHTNEFKFVKEREQAAKELHADFIATQLPDGRLYSLPVISMPHALNPKAFFNMGLKRTISVGFRGAKYKPGIHDDRTEIVNAFKDVPNADILLDKDKFLSRSEWAVFLNRCKAIPGCEAGNEGARIISPRHLEAIGCGTLQILKKGEFCGVIDERHYLPFTNVQDAMDVVNDRLRSEITERALTHVLENHTYKHRMEQLMRSV
jgi:hypothetical protein